MLLKEGENGEQNTVRNVLCREYSLRAEGE